MTVARTGYGTEFHLEDENGVLQEMGEMYALEPGAEAWNFAEATHMKSPGKRIERIATLLDGGAGNFQVNWDPGSPTDTRISEAWSSGAVRAFKIVVPTNVGRWAISGFVIVASRTPTIPLDNRMTCQINLQFTGARDEEATA